jgi:predicted MFS family arabinose efflux permease
VTRRLAALFAAACSLAIGGIYAAQPMLDAIAVSVGLSHGAAGIVVTVTQLGYGLGLVLIAPLGDAVDRRRLIGLLLWWSVVALLVAAGAPTRVVLLLSLTATGFMAVVIQVLVAYAASLAAPHERGRVIGTVTSGVAVGVVLSRAVPGVVADLSTWRAVYLGAAALTAIVGVALWRTVPAEQPRAMRAGLLRSTFTLYRTEPVLRHRAVLAALTFAGLTALWTPLVLVLSAPPLSLPYPAIGLLGLVGFAGAIAAARAGRLADRGSARTTTGVALVLMLAAWLPIALVRHSLIALVVGLILVDVAVQAVHVTSQSLIASIDPEARSRLVAAYMLWYAIGGAAGAIAATAMYAWRGWTGVCLLGAAISAAAIGYWCRVEVRGARLTPAGGTARTRAGQRPPR